MKDIMTAPFVEEMRKTTANMYRLGWDERNGGNISYMLEEDEVKEYLDLDKVSVQFPQALMQPTLSAKFLSLRVRVSISKMLSPIPKPTSALSV